ncbi:C-C motif chemokine 20b [Misgurnus anguillicaudatus]|uniref:C-C motif chemokine 20b n=1 Tax=Misgurnus anguillicaudatus TaxID=75329 RepID=UPI0024357514|nr:C-C motif chemokine 20b [Misgurnus anguillicaudatus]
MMNMKICTLGFILCGVFIMETEAAKCCLTYSQREIPCRRLKGYDIQGITGRCDMPAIIFHRLGGKLVCADPAERWTQERVKCLKLRAAEMKTGKTYLV